MIDYSFPIEELEYFLLILTRITCFIYIAPFVGIRGIPNRVKIGLGFFISYLVYHVQTPHIYVEYNTIVGYSVIVLKEAVVGLLIGLSASICESIVLFAGRNVDMQIGLSMASEFDPMTQEQSTVSGTFFHYMFLLFMIVSGMYRYFAKAIADTFVLIPVGGAVIHTDRLLESLLQFLVDYMIIGFRISLPVFVVIMILNCVLGVLAKVAPQMNMFAVGIQIKIIVGIGVLFFTVGMLPAASNFVFEEMKRMMTAFVGGFI